MFTARSLRSVFEGKRVLVTGHTGFKGSWLSVWLLELGAHVSGFSLPGEAALFDQLKLGKKLHDQRGNIRDRAAFGQAVEQAQPDFIFHLAAQALVRTSYREPLETFAVNAIGTAHLLEACRALRKACTVICITTDKVYRNNESLHAYHEDDPLGGRDPYSASKAAAEIVIASYRDSFFRDDSSIRVASARAGNVIGGGDWAEDRIVPDCIRALQRKDVIGLRNPGSTRPWQHVLEPLSGYLCLAAALSREPQNRALASAFNFGPGPASNQTVRELVETILRRWPGEWRDISEASQPHEAGRLNLATDKAAQLLRWTPAWSFEETVTETVDWYREFLNGGDAWNLSTTQIEHYLKAASPLR